MQYSHLMLYDSPSFPAAYRQAREQFRNLHQQATWRSLWSALTGRRHNLLSLDDVQKHHDQAQERSYLGLRLVPIAQIRGSEGRSADFDADFRPLKAYNQDRWIRVAAARSQDMALPAVQLVQVNDCYFVRDGHHRISVAKMMGQMEIEAEVTLWRGASLPGQRNQHAIRQPVVFGASSPGKRLRDRLIAVSRWLVTLGERFRTRMSPEPCTPAVQCSYYGRPKSI
jgi:hypothetical protein